MLAERDIESCYLGQFIPLHYHHNMLMDQRRMKSFKEAISQVVFPGAKVLELGGGTGVLSFFAAATAEKVWCVEFNPDMVDEARRLLSRNAHGHKIEVVQADAFEYLPPEPVDVVICEMIHVGMLREKQVDVMASFKQRYLARFGGPLPLFVPDAVIMAVQPLQLDYDFEGFNAPIVQFRELTREADDTLEMAGPQVYSTMDFQTDVDPEIRWCGDFMMAHSGTVTSLRFITKNILAVLVDQQTTIDWLNNFMILPLDAPVEVLAGDVLQVSFNYRAGGSLPSLQLTMTASVAARGSDRTLA
ncbi:methyltransferase domain-containing protein [Actimicrobium sp. CCC2.4]|uniref:methyltransferase domain-containing protein n=1 Tax=Actimicrobium sp. CCC2.4 TaxID=3048606 RepID=UPI002AC96199|nr:methyltransferase domain-containing protein [Actimicrobium sp. CCC2.4]MEB0134831.1 methyltransferase domain-containing protein [Actimicrobium sp. CCC2.4]WPX34166.1 methyltransferase domain-containing protein [Actimicrobium sp. CCC2.4]